MPLLLIFKLFFLFFWFWKVWRNFQPSGWLAPSNCQWQFLCVCLCSNFLTIWLQTQVLRKLLHNQIVRKLLHKQTQRNCHWQLEGASQPDGWKFLQTSQNQQNQKNQMKISKSGIHKPKKPKKPNENKQEWRHVVDIHYKYNGLGASHCIFIRNAMDW